MRKRLWIFAVATLGLAVHATWYRRYVSDDAYISLRFAQRLVNGHGLTWTDGERVEGYSNLLWVLACAGLRGIGLDLVVAARLLGFAGMTGGLWFVIRAQKTLPAGAVAALAWIAAGPVAVWTVGGLEPPFEAVFLAWATCEALSIADQSSLHGLHRMGVPLAALAVTRPDGLLWTATLCLALLLVHRAPKILSVALLPLLATLAQLIFRLVYYRDWLPNTAWGKLRFGAATLSSGLSYLKSGSLGLSGLLLLAALALLWGPRRRMVVIVLPLVVWLGYVACVGGDFMPAHRLLVPAIVLLALAAGEFIAALDGFGRDARIRGWLAAAVAGAWFCLAQFHDPENLFARSQTWASDGLKLGEIFRRGLGDGSPLIALDAAGAIAYAWELPALDMLGLCDRWIAHRPTVPSRYDMVGHSLGDGDYVLGRQPDVVVFCGPYGGEPCFAGGRQMQADARFSDYQPVTVSGDGFQSRVFVRRHGRAGITSRDGHTIVPGWLFASVPGNQARLDEHAQLEGVLRAAASVDTGRSDLHIAEADPRDTPVAIAVSETGEVRVTPTAGTARLRAIVLR